jgi:hypothetical protein
MPSSPSQPLQTREQVTYVIASDEAESCETQSTHECESQFAWEMRVMLVSAVWTLPGVLFGVLVRAFVPDGGPIVFWLAGGAVLGAIAGGILEADHWLW